MEFNEQEVQDYLKQKFQGRDSFLENIIFPIFGEDHFEEGYDAELLNDPGVRHDAEKVGIRSIITYGRVGIDLGSVQIFDITVTDHVLLARNRVTVQGIIRRILGTFHGAFMIFHYADTQRWDWRFSFCCKGDKDITEAKRFTFLLGPNQSCRTAAQNFVKLAASASASASPTMDDIKRAFDVEALSNEFFAKYKTYYEGIVKYITGKCFKKIGGKWKEVSEGVPNEEIYAQFDHDDKAVRDYVKKMLGRIVFLHFLQKKGWLGAKKSWDDGDREFMLHLYNHASDRQKNDFLDAVLEPLFDRALDVDRSARGDVFDTGISGIGKVKIPYLNGGLFTRDTADEKAVRLPCEYFHNFLVFLSQYNFTIDENDPSDAEVGVDPEMLSRIFENLLEDNKDKGAIYTPKPIVEYMCRQSLIAYLQTDMPEAEHAAIEKFVKTYDPSDLTKKTALTIDKKLKLVKICDPAIGSGAFPMGMLRELYFCRTALEEDLGNHRPAEIKRQIIQENIYGVDIEKGAVDIARLRFWLALVVDEPTPHTLPNLDFKIMQGNSLLENYKGVPLDSLLQDRRPVSKKAKQGKFAFDTHKTYTQDELALGGESASHAITALMGEYYSTDNREHKQQILSAINDQVKGYIKGQINNSDLNAEIDALECQNDKFFLWHTWFADVFARGGFDIVIGNPPYIRPHRLSDETKKELWHNFETYEKKADIYVCFMEIACKIVKDSGVLTYIVSDGWLRLDSFEKIRQYILRTVNVVQIIDFADDVFDSATVKTCIFTMSKNMTPDNVLKAAVVDDARQLNTLPFKDINQSMFHSTFKNVFDLSVDGNVLSLKDKIRNCSQCLGMMFELAFGLKTGDDEKFLTFDPKKSPDCKHLVRGADINRWTIVFKGEYVIYQPDRMRSNKQTARPGDSRRFEQPKVLVRDTGGGLMATFDPDNYYVKDVIVIEDSQRRDSFLKVLAALLNSKVMRWFYETTFPTLHVQRDEVASLPMPTWFFESSNQKPIIALVDQILAAKKADPNADTSALESEIDQLVYKLYGLTDDEIAIVEGRNETKQEPQGETARRPAATSRRRKQVTTPAPPEPANDEVLE